MSDEPVLSRKPSNPLWTAARVVITIGVVAFIIKRLADQWDAVKELRAHPSLVDGTVAIVTGALAYVGLAVLFAFTLKAVGHDRKEHRFFYLRLWLQPYLYKYVPGKVMLAVERVRLGREIGLPGSELILLLLWETVFLMVGAALVVGVAFGFARVPDDGGSVSWIVPSIAGSAVLLVAFPWVLKAAMIVPALKRRLQNLGSLSIPIPAQLGLVLGYAVVWLCFSTSFLFFCRWFVPVEGSDAASVLFWYVAAYVAGFVSSVTPGGIGVREGILAVGLGPVLGPAQAAALAVAGRIFTTIIELIMTAAGWSIPIPKDAGGAR
jgi:hypothetical protein